MNVSASMGWFIATRKDGCPLRKINLESVYRVSAALAPLKRELAKDTLVRQYVAILEARVIFEPFVETWREYLGVSKDAAEKALQQLIALTEGLHDEFHEKKPKNDEAREEGLSRLRDAVIRFEAVFAEESPHIHSYVVDQVAGLDMRLLIDDALTNIDESLRPELPDGAKRDYREAGRALAFDLFTASGFHALRSLEAVILVYHDLLTGESLPLAKKTLGVILARLKGENNKKAVALARLTSLLEHLKDQDRNPLFHPDRAPLDRPEALTLFPLVTGAIHEFAAAIKALRAQS